MTLKTTSYDLESAINRFIDEKPYPHYSSRKIGPSAPEEHNFLTMIFVDLNSCLLRFFWVTGRNPGRTGFFGPPKGPIGPILGQRTGVHFLSIYTADFDLIHLLSMN